MSFTLNLIDELIRDVLAELRDLSALRRGANRISLALIDRWHPTKWRTLQMLLRWREDVLTDTSFLKKSQTVPAPAQKDA